MPPGKKACRGGSRTALNASTVIGTPYGGQLTAERRPGAGFRSKGIQIKAKIHIFDWLKRLTVWLVLLYRRTRYGYAFRRIRLVQPRYAIVDPEDYERLRKYEWEARRTRRSPFYTARQTLQPTGRKFTLIFMHREIIEVDDGLLVDHKNHNSIDNRKANLRPATYTQSNRNRRKFSGQSNSKYKGVYWKKHIKKWVAQIGVNRKVIHLGCFDKEIDTAKAYDEGAKQYHGEFTSPNFPP